MKSPRRRFQLYLRPTPQLFPKQVPEGERVTEEGASRITQDNKTRQTENATP